MKGWAAMELRSATLALACKSALENATELMGNTRVSVSVLELAPRSGSFRGSKKLPLAKQQFVFGGSGSGRGRGLSDSGSSGRDRDRGRGRGRARGHNDSSGSTGSRSLGASGIAGDSSSGSGGGGGGGGSSSSSSLTISSRNRSMGRGLRLGSSLGGGGDSTSSGGRGGRGGGGGLGGLSSGGPDSSSSSRSGRGGGRGGRPLGGGIVMGASRSAGPSFSSIASSISSSSSSSSSSSRSRSRSGSRNSSADASSSSASASTSAFAAAAAAAAAAAEAEALLSVSSITDAYLKHRFITTDGTLRPALEALLASQFFSASEDDTVSYETVNSSPRLGQRSPAKDVTPASRLRLFLGKMGGQIGSIKAVFSNFGVEGTLDLIGLCNHVAGCATETPVNVAQALLTLGFDLDGQPFRPVAASDCKRVAFETPFTLAMDYALVAHLDEHARALHLIAGSVRPCDHLLTDAQRAQADYAVLQDVPTVALRLRVALLQALGEAVDVILPLVDLRMATHRHSLAALVAEARPLLFYDHKAAFATKLIDETAQRTDPNDGPEVTLDPLEGSGYGGGTIPQFVQAMHMLDLSNTWDLRVKQAEGGDPLFPLIIRFTGENVQGTSGSFRDFMLRMAHELQSDALPLLMEAPSAAYGVSVGKWLLRPGRPTFQEQTMLEFLGLVLGVALRSDVPVPLDLLPSFWKSLTCQELDADLDIGAADHLMATRLRKVKDCATREAFETLLAEEPMYFGARTLGDGGMVNLPLDGDATNTSRVPVTWANRDQYIAGLKELRLGELNAKSRTDAVRRGMARIIPPQLLNVLGARDLELRCCGLPDVDIPYLRQHTTYSVGLGETDPHVVFFWNALEGFSPEELRMFIKFACNQERIPTGGGDAKTHVPPYPMKIAPPVSSSGGDNRMIRAETCMFMIKLPQYSSQEIMTARLKAAVRCREDPLTG